MTSKQALLKLCFKYLPTIDEMHINLDEEDEVLLKTLVEDLEVLEILKKYMWFSFHKELGFQVFCNDTIDLGNEEEFNLLKKVLNNDKKN